MMRTPFPDPLAPLLCCVSGAVVAPPSAAEADGPARASGRSSHQPYSLPVSSAGAGRHQWSSDQLFGDRQEIEIVHGDSIYRLRVTSLGKLILTK